MLSRLYKLVFDLSICHIIGSFLLHFFGGVTLHTGEFICLLAAGSISILLWNKRRLSLLAVGIVPLVGVFLLQPRPAELAVYTLTWGYMLFVIYTDRFVISRGDFLEQARKMLYFALLLPILMLTKLQAFQYAIATTIPYLITAIVSFGFMLRHLRHNSGMDGKNVYRQQTWEMLLFLVVCVLLTIVQAPQNLWQGLRLLFLGVIQPIFAFLAQMIGMLIGGIIYLVVSLLSLVTGNRELDLRKNELGDNVRETLERNVDTVTDRQWILPILYSLVVILGLIVLFFFFRRLMGEKFKLKLPEGISEIREEIKESIDGQDRTRRKYLSEPRERIRYYYYKYLLYLCSRKVSIFSQDTTREVDRKYRERYTELSGNQIDASKQMKELYRKARYQSREEITADEAERAKKLYYAMKK